MGLEQVESIGNLFEIDCDVLAYSITREFFLGGDGVFHGDEVVHFREDLLLQDVTTE